MINNRKYKCECGYKLKGKPSVLITPDKEVCPNCGKIQYLKYAPQDAKKITKGIEIIKKSKIF